jgi:hypothetical protein
MKIADTLNRGNGKLISCCYIIEFEFINKEGHAMKIDKFIKIILGLITVLLLINLISGYLPSKSVQA